MIGWVFFNEIPVMNHSLVTWGGASPGEHPNSRDGERVCANGPVTEKQINATSCKRSLRRCKFYFISVQPLAQTRPSCSCVLGARKSPEGRGTRPGVQRGGKGRGGKALCVCSWVCVCVHVGVCACACERACVRTCVCMRTRACTCVHAGTGVAVHTCVRVSTCVCVACACACAPACQPAPAAAARLRRRVCAHKGRAHCHIVTLPWKRWQIQIRRYTHRWRSAWHPNSPPAAAPRQRASKRTLGRWGAARHHDRDVPRSPAWPACPGGFLAPLARHGAELGRKVPEDPSPGEAAGRGFSRCPIAPSSGGGPRCTGTARALPPRLCLSFFPLAHPLKFLRGFVGCVGRSG